MAAECLWGHPAFKTDFHLQAKYSEKDECIKYRNNNNNKKTLYSFGV